MGTFLDGAAFAKKMGYTSDNSKCTPLAGGRNNHVYRIETDKGRFLLKAYRRDDHKERLAAESRFLRFCQQAGLKAVPNLVAEDVKNGLALHTWVDGSHPVHGEATQENIMAAAEFIKTLTQVSQKKSTLDGVLQARDACLRFADYFRSPRERIDRLEKCLLDNPDAPLNNAVLNFVTYTLKPLWRKVRDAAKARLAGKDLLSPFSNVIYSPSDFGFHNALCTTTGLKFIDFEYAGIDDPAKVIADFLCQADYDVPDNAGWIMAEACCQGFGKPEWAGELWERIGVLLPLVRIKFVCIVLNVFTQTGVKYYDEKNFLMRSTQLAKAKKICGNV